MQIGLQRLQRIHSRVGFQDDSVQATILKLWQSDSLGNIPSAAYQNSALCLQFEVRKSFG